MVAVSRRVWLFEAWARSAQLCVSHSHTGCMLVVLELIMQAFCCFPYGTASCASQQAGLILRGMRVVKGAYGESSEVALTMRTCGTVLAGAYLASVQF